MRNNKTLNTFIIWNFKMNLKESLICNICKNFLHDPVYLPCHCYVCNDHVLTNDNKIKCLNCNEGFTKSNQLKKNIADF